MSAAASAAIHIEAVSEYVEAESDPAAGRYLFAYTITIVNGGDAPAQLLNRHWQITDGNGAVEEVQGPGVVGRQPRLEPGEAFRYTSAAVLRTPVGAMTGSYEFCRDDGSRFEAPIPAFSLAAPDQVH